MAIRIIRPSIRRGHRVSNTSAHLRLCRYSDSATSYARVTIPPEVSKKAGLVAGMRVDFYIDDEENSFGVLPVVDGRLKLSAQVCSRPGQAPALYIRGAMPADAIEYLTGFHWSYDGMQPIGKVRAITFAGVPGSTEVKIVNRRKIK
jgi:bifunctional DNA-binding transcriptional regulator/antitoxin component of YhaV-PrlF toxin-antitoxin module